MAIAMPLAPAAPHPSTGRVSSRRTPSRRPAPHRPVRRPAGTAVHAHSAGSAGSAGSAARPGVRLTARGRVVLLVAAIAAVLAVLVSTGSVQAGSAAPAGPATDLVVVQPGQSLWSIAADVAPAADRRATIDAIMTLNGLVDAVVHPGQPLVVPVG